jgi:hypothetical protein
MLNNINIKQILKEEINKIKSGKEEELTYNLFYN